MSRLKLISPSPIVTGSISASTRRMRGSRQLNEIESWKPTRLSTGRHIANWTTVPASTPIA
jgi:hypothetical protein